MEGLTVSSEKRDLSTSMRLFASPVAFIQSNFLGEEKSKELGP